jgi:hypothetical protein
MDMEAFAPGAKPPGFEGDYSLPASAKISNAWSFTSTPQYVLCHGV